MADNVFRTYLLECGYETDDYLHYAVEDLNQILKKFWFEVRQKPKNPDEQAKRYSKATLQNIRHALNRNLQNAGRKFDITCDPEVTESNKSYVAACKELKKLGLVVVHSYPEILHSGKLFFHNLTNYNLMNLPSQYIEIMFK